MLVGSADNWGLSTGRWAAPTLAALRRFVERQSATRLGDERRVAVFDADGTLWLEDIGEAFLQRLYRDRRLVDYDYRVDPYAEYEARCAVDTTAGYGYCAQVMAGMEERVLDELAAEFYREFRHHCIPEMVELVQALRAVGVEVWIVSASNRWLVRQAMVDFGVPPERVLAIHTRVVEGRLTAELVEPVTNLDGKVRAIEQSIGVTPLLAAGNSANDAPMLAIASGIRLMINPSEALRRRADEWWLAAQGQTETSLLTQWFGA